LAVAGNDLRRLDCAGFVPVLQHKPPKTNQKQKREKPCRYWLSLVCFGFLSRSNLPLKTAARGTLFSFRLRPQVAGNGMPDNRDVKCVSLTSDLATDQSLVIQAAGSPIYWLMGGRVFATTG
jgi:hypothetical protein